MFYATLGIVGALVFIIGDIPYFIDTLSGKTKPHRVTWGIVVLLNLSINIVNHTAGLVRP